VDKLEQWKQDGVDGKRRNLSEKERHDQAAYRSRRLNAGRLPKSFEDRLSHAYQIKKKQTRDKIARLKIIKEFAEL
jgi:hypothetical protein